MRTRSHKRYLATCAPFLSAGFLLSASLVGSACRSGKKGNEPNAHGDNLPNQLLPNPTDQVQAGNGLGSQGAGGKVVVVPGAAYGGSGERAHPPLLWNGFRIYGGGHGVPCSPANVAIAFAGGDASFVFSNLKIDMPATTQWNTDLSQQLSCNIESKIVIPRGYYVRTLAQSLAGGVHKDRGVLGGISSNGFLFQKHIPLNQINVEFLPEETIDQTKVPLFVKHNTQNLKHVASELQCLQTREGPWTTDFKLQILAAAVRPLPYLNFILNLDSNDFHYNLAADLALCSEL